MNDYFERRANVIWIQSSNPIIKDNRNYIDDIIDNSDKFIKIKNLKSGDVLSIINKGLCFICDIDEAINIRFVISQYVLM